MDVFTEYLRTVEPLCAALKDECSSVRKAAARALGEIKDPRAIKPLITALKEDKEVQGDVVKALAKLGKPAVEPLILALKDKDVRKKAAETLDRLGWETKEKSEKALYLIAKQEWDECAELGKPAVEPLIAVIKDESIYTRGGAIEALGKLGDGRAVEPLILALKDKNRGVQEKAVEALGRLGDSRAVEPLSVALKDEDRHIRKKAVEALGRLGDNRAVDPLVVALKDEDTDIQKKAAEALDKLGWEPKEKSEKALYFIVKQEWNECVKLGKPAVDPLITALKDESIYTRGGAVEALGKIGDGRAVKPLSLALKDRYVRKKAVEALGRLGDGRAVEPLITALKDEDRYVRKKAVEALGNLGKPATEPLVAALKDEHRYIRKGAAEVLDELGWEAKEESEKILYFIAKQKWDECVKLGKPAVEPLIAIIKDRHLRADAAKALENITEQNFGQDPERWQEWWKENRESFHKAR